MALMQQARFHEADASLKKAADLLPARDPRRENARQLQQECQRFVTLDARLPTILQETEKPADAAEQIEFARLCILKKLYAAAARLYADAFAMKPQLAEESIPSSRYAAACSAALAGCGRGEDGAKLGDAERTRWRDQAREWLRADLTALGKALDGAPAARDRARQTLTRWRGDPDLARLREPDALEKLSVEERDEWLTLWKEVDALRNRTTSP
jgi:serine/threonine-protein kinase